MSAATRLISARLLPAVFAAAVLVWGAGARAQEPCADAMTQHEINQCVHAEWERADRELNRAYDAAMARARAFDAGWDHGRADQTLRMAQRVWITFRDAACDAEAATWDGGSGYAMIPYGCFGRLTMQRTEDLWVYAGQ